VAESVDAPDLKSVGIKPVRVQVSLALLAHCVPNPTTILESNNIMRNFKINSTAISDLNMDGDQVNIQFTSSDKQYTFRVADPSGFVAELEQVIADPEGSVGSYIHSARKSEALVEV